MEFVLNLMATLAYATAAALAVAQRHGRSVVVLLLAGVTLQTIALGQRWVVLGHGPFTTLYEVLASNLWSLALLFAVAYAAIDRLRPAALVVLPLLLVMAVWMLSVDDGPGHFPPTFSTALLYLHAGFGKLFLGPLLVAAGLGGVVLLRRWPAAARPWAAMPASPRLEDLAYRFAALAFVFDTLMLITGAVWAQDAWGRYWAWDPLETWAFMTWLLLAFTLHWRIRARSRPEVSAGLLVATFALAFLTFFGVPFVSVSPHKGVF